MDVNKKFYFEFYVGDKDKNGDIVLYIRTDIESNIYICKNNDYGMIAPSKSNHDYMSSTGSKGGLTSITINKDSKGFCVDCTYIGLIDSKEEGEISILVEIEHYN